MLPGGDVTPTLKKSSIFVKKTAYLRHIIQPRRQELSETTPTDTLKLKNTTKQKETRSFSGLCDAFCQFFPKFSTLTEPLNKKLRNYQPTSLYSHTQAEEEALESLRALLTNPPVLALPCIKGKFTVATDGCDPK